ncbi:Glutamate receptor ionotropic, kainate 2 [Portunus trituberculatus]|uniref:Glutamate receptor ionotropic, kainate 2 n=1 Tax=Portunus trituberculatus TaxID=210409 RepID=A0A5B7GHB6_PORTR|nr:Glutamate receptor ionotropic, kainate 2 [Portunus trituberculatus]
MHRCFTRLGAWRHGKRGPASSRLADDGGSNEGVTFSSRKREAEVSERFSPYEWTNPHPCDTSPEKLDNDFSLLNCLWFCIGSLMQQGGDLLPKHWKQQPSQYIRLSMYPFRTCLTSHVIVFRDPPCLRTKQYTALDSSSYMTRAVLRLAFSPSPECQWKAERVRV